ncbi:MAG: DUF6881 domain-containing protein [Rubrobacteraceae bacterium]|nr:hypothetical protein [Rubrobacter sp.]
MSPTYERYKWIHDFEDEPYLFYEELDDERYAIRRIEIFKDGKIVRAGEEDLERDPMALPDQPVPTVEETNAQEEFQAQEITTQEFEEA